MKGELKNGFKFEIDDDIQDDMELIDAIAAADENPAKISTVVYMMLGEDQRKKLYDHVRGENGKVSAKAIGECIMEMIEASGETGKN